jgi:hypothetical protein
MAEEPFRGGLARNRIESTLVESFHEVTWLIIRPHLCC